MQRTLLACTRRLRLVRGDRRSYAEDFREHLLGNGFHAAVVQENVRSGQQIRVRTDLSYDTGAETCETD